MSKNTCANCKHFNKCFTESNALLGISVEHITKEMVDECEKIPACAEWEDFTPLLADHIKPI